MKTKILLEIEKIFKDEDPQHLIKIGAPDHEYNHEALELYNTIDDTYTTPQIQIKLWNIFFKYFCNTKTVIIDGKSTDLYMPYSKAIGIVGTYEDYYVMAKKIKEVLINN
jgi:hypothetical protein